MTKYAHKFGYHLGSHTEGDIILINDINHRIVGVEPDTVQVSPMDGNETIWDDVIIHDRETLQCEFVRRAPIKQMASFDGKQFVPQTKTPLLPLSAVIERLRPHMGSTDDLK